MSAATAGATGRTLRVDGVVKRFGGLTALAGVSFEMPPAVLWGVLGMNGSGKTTLLNCINGLYAPDKGAIALGDTVLAGRPVHYCARQGVRRTFQVPRVFGRMTLLDNLRVPLLAERRPEDEAQADIRRWLERFDLWRLRHNHASELSGGQQKLLELARVLVARPSLVLLDEPFAGVNPTLARLMMQAIAELPGQGMGVLMVSHDLTSVYELSSHVLVMNEGQLLARGTPEEVQTNPDVVEAYLGT